MEAIGGMVATWLLDQVLDASGKQLRKLLGSEQQNALRKAVAAAVRNTAQDFKPAASEEALFLATVINQVFRKAVPAEPLSRHATFIQAIHASIATQLAVLGNASITGTKYSSADLMGVSTSALAESLNDHLIAEILTRGAVGSPLAPLASQLRDDMAYLKMEKIERLIQKNAESAGRDRAQLADLEYG